MRKAKEVKKARAGLIPSSDATRKERAMAILQNSDALVNGLEIPEYLPRYLGTEEGFGNLVWAFFANTKNEMAANFEASETDAIQSRRLHDLDTGKIYAPVFRLMQWKEVPND